LSRTKLSVFTGRCTSTTGIRNGRCSLIDSARDGSENSNLHDSDNNSINCDLTSRNGRWQTPLPRYNLRAYITSFIVIVQRAYVDKNFMTRTRAMKCSHSWENRAAIIHRRYTVLVRIDNK
jgi:hypothetical protein